MNNIEIKLYESTPVSYETVIDKSRFTPNKSLGWWWLQRLCFWILTRLNCFATNTIEHYTTRKIEFTGSIFEDIYQQMYTLKRHGREPDFILMGVAENHDLRRICYTSYSIGVNEYERSGLRDKLFGLDIRVLDWVKGVVVVPK